LVLIAAYPLVIGVSAWHRSSVRGPALTHTAKGLLIVCAVQMAVFGLVFGLAWLASRASREDLLCRWRPGWWTLPLGIGYSVAIRLAVGIVMIAAATALLASGLFSAQRLQEFLLAIRPDVESLVDVAALRRNPLYFWLSVTVVSFVVAGLREELWRSAFLAALRTLWPGRFGSTTGQFMAVGLAAVAFGLGHLGQGPLGVWATALLGFCLGAIMVFHRSIWPAVIAHGMFDATSLAILPWAMELLRQVQPT
jgi:membrane protease YdiL (CAAX protease family)